MGWEVYGNSLYQYLILNFAVNLKLHFKKKVFNSNNNSKKKKKKKTLTILYSFFRQGNVETVKLSGRTRTFISISLPSKPMIFLFYHTGDADQWPASDLLVLTIPIHTFSFLPGACVPLLLRWQKCTWSIRQTGQKDQELMCWGATLGNNRGVSG